MACLWQSYVLYANVVCQKTVNDALPDDGLVIVGVQGDAASADGGVYKKRGHPTGDALGVCRVISSS